jgi:D-glycero-D-manno-heptose 1,7-bisphosphate phosphatase
MRVGAFVDRDGTLCEEREYLSDPDGVVLLPGAARGVAMLNRAGVAVVVVTNQSGVARGMFGEDAVRAVNERLRELLAAQGAILDGMYYCPHHPDAGQAPYRSACDCRKPAPGMAHRAAAELNLDLGRSVTVGDKASDVLLAGRAGCRAGVLVLTGYGAEQQHRLEAVGRAPDYTAGDFLAAARWIICELAPDGEQA